MENTYFGPPGPVLELLQKEGIYRSKSAQLSPPA